MISPNQIRPAAIAFAMPLILAANAALAAGPTEPASPPDSTFPAQASVIGEIEIRTENVFTDEEAKHHFFPYGLLNALHRTTRPAFVRQELTVNEGDSLSAADLAESERNLRHLQIFRNVAVTSDSGNVSVVTADSWTAKPWLGVSRGGGVNTATIGVEDRNFLGTCRRIQLLYDQGEERTARTISVTDPGATIPHTTVAVTGSDYSDGWGWAAAVTRPFQRFEDRFAASGSFQASDISERAYAGGVPVAQWRQIDHFGDASLMTCMQRSGNSLWRVGVSGSWQDWNYRQGALGSPPPDSSRSYLFFMGHLEHDGRAWIKRRNIDEIDRDEDFNLSPSCGLAVGASPGLFETRQAAQAQASVSDGVALGSGGFALVSATAASRREDAVWRQTIVTGEARAYVSPIPRTTFLTRVGATMGERLDPGQEIALDGDHGVRAYRLHAATGTSQAVGNLEARTRVASDLLHIVSLGTAVFWDGGVSNGPPDGHVMLADAGAGLRLGLTRASSHTLVRVDFARALVADPSGWKGWQFSFATGQAF